MARRRTWIRSDACRWRRSARLTLVESLEMYVNAGLPISTSLEAISEGMTKRKKASLIRASAMIASGQPLSSAMEKEVGLPAGVRSLIACGESSGSLGRALSYARANMERESDLRSRCLSASTYPAVIALAAAALAFGLVRGVLPQIVPMLDGLHARLPAITVAVMAASDFMTRYGAYAAAATAVAAAAGYAMYSRSTRAKRLAHLAVDATPFIGGLVRSYELSVFFASFGSLLASGMQADAGLERSAASIGFLPIRDRLASKIDPVRRGERVRSICEIRMPPYVEALIAAGESSGRLPESLMRVSELLGKDLDRDLKRLTALIEPAMMVLMGAVVGSIALAIMMPIYDISKSIGR